MIRGLTCGLGVDPGKPKLGQTEFLDKGIDHPNWIALADPILQPFRKQRALAAINSFNEALHPIPRNPRRIIPRESYRKRARLSC
jgi:hypothetical protein